jgi:hypothetical protein
MESRVKSKPGILYLVVVALIAVATAIAHMSCIFLGPECFSAQMAPPQVIESAKNGTWLAPVGTIFISAIFLVVGLYALSGAGIIRKLPLLKLGIYTISTLCIIRGVLPLQLWIRHPEKVNSIVFYTGVIWLVTGLLFLFGYLLVQKSAYNKQIMAGTREQRAPHI